MDLSAAQREVLLFLNAKGGSSNEEALRAAFGDTVVPLLAQLVGSYVWTETYTADRTQAADVRRGRQVMYSLTDAGRAEARP